MKNVRIVNAKEDFLLCAPPLPTHTLQDWQAADNRGYDLNHVFTDGYSKLFPGKKVHGHMFYGLQN